MKQKAKEMGVKMIEEREDEEVIGFMMMEETFHWDINDNFPLSKYLCALEYLPKYGKIKNKAMGG